MSISLQDDAAANLRVNTAGQTGSFGTTNDQPAAGTQPSIIVPTGKKWVVKAINLFVTTDATVANRNVGLRVTDASGQVILDQFVASSTTSVFNQTASQNISFNFGPGCRTDFGNIMNRFSSAIPELVLGPGCTIQGEIFPIQTGDLGNLTVSYQEYLD